MSLFGKPGTRRGRLACEAFRSFVNLRRENAAASGGKGTPLLEQLYRSIHQVEAESGDERSSELSWAFDRLAKNRFILGSPEECIDQIAEYKERLGIGYMLPRFDWTPGLGQEHILASMRLFGEKVIQKL